MKMFEKNGFLRLEWTSESGLKVKGHGHPADLMLAAIVAVKDVIESNTRPEDHKACAQELAELLVELMDLPMTTIDLGAIMGGVRGMSKAFDPAELEEMRADLDRNPGYRGLGVVAQLHACKRGDVIDALGLDPEDYARKPKPKVTPEQRADAVARVLAGENTADIATELGINKNTVYAWVSKAKQDAAAQPESTVKTPPQRPAVKLSAVAQSHFEDLDAAIDYMRQADLLSEEEFDALERFLATLGAFARGLEFAEEHAERSAE